MANLLEQLLRAMTVVVADTGDMEAMEKFRPQDSTTNRVADHRCIRSCLYYQPIVDGVPQDARKQLGDSADEKDVAKLAFSSLAVAFGKKILKVVPGRVSTEVDARLSYNTEATIAQAREIIAQSTIRRASDATADAGENCLDLGRHSRRGSRNPGEGRHPLQPDTALWVASGDRPVPRRA